MLSSFKVISIAAIAGIGLITAAFAQPQGHRFDASSLDTSHDGVISDAELGVHLDQLFAHADADHDGELNQAEIGAFHQMMRGATSSSTMAHGGGQPMVTTMSQAQFRQVMAGFASGLDADGDHVLTVVELNAAFLPGPAR